jgi:hypothetical protein
MSIHSDLMRSGAELLFAVQGDAGAVLYQPETGQAFAWSGASVGAETGGLEEQETTGDLLKVFRMTVAGPTGQLVAKGVKTIERNATVKIGEQVWSIDVPESRWGPSIVRLGLIRRPITRKREMESAADGRG